MPSTEERVSVFSEVSQLSAATKTVANHLQQALTSDQAWEVTSTVSKAVGRWLTEVCGFPIERASYFSTDADNALELAILYALYTKYPDAHESGYIAAMAGAVPVVYISDVFEYGTGARVAPNLSKVLQKLGFSGIHCRKVQFCQDISQGYQMDCDDLEHIIQEDKQAGLTPLMVISSLGTAGYELDLWDDLKRIRSICDDNEMCLHVLGSSLALLFNSEEAHNEQIVQDVQAADTVCLDLNNWFGLAGTSTCTIVRQDNIPMFDGHDSFTTLPLWVYMQRVGRDFMVNQISFAVELTQYLHKNLEVLDNTIYIEHPDSTQSPHLVFFSYDPTKLLLSCINSQSYTSSSEQDDDAQHIPDWFPSLDVLNAATATLVERLNYGIDIMNNALNSLAFSKVTNTTTGRVMIRFNAVPALGVGTNLSRSSIDLWLDELEICSQLFNATLLYSPMFHQYFGDGTMDDVSIRIPGYLRGDIEMPEIDMDTIHPNSIIDGLEMASTMNSLPHEPEDLVLEPIQEGILAEDGFEWLDSNQVALGSFRLVPSYLKSTDGPHPEGLGELNSINTMLVEALNEENQMFSLYERDDGIVGITLEAVHSKSKIIHPHPSLTPPFSHLISLRTSLMSGHRIASRNVSKS
eukprot:TRINITY_DN1047_c0_g1_i3.p1 TRINITY_DN1047_c0_g1~~TRINITY_DN1047_c0_g1_i3.p1  ORF type:complete len:635 (-),score=140.67 TRINITY_DN1047_c0_g1_i3:498-2402(-)